MKTASLSLAPSNEYRLLEVIGMMVAAGAGVLIANEPLSFSAIALAIFALAGLALIAPLVAMMVLLVLAPMRTLIATEAPTQLPVDIGLLTLTVFFVVWFVQRVASRQRLLYFRWSVLFIPLLAYVFVICLTLFNAASVSAWLAELLKWALIIMMITLVLNLGYRQWEWVVFGLALAGAANAIVGIYIFLGGSGALHLLVSGRFFRAFGTFGQPNPFGGFMGLLVPLTTMMAYGYLRQVLEARNRKAPIRQNDLLGTGFYAAISMLMVLGLFFSWSRGAWLGFGVSGLAVLFALPRRTWHGVLMLVVVLALGLGIWSTGRLPASISNRVSSATQELFTLNDVRAVDITPENYAIVERLAHWQAALSMVESRPWLGVGFGNYEIAYDDYRLLNWEDSLGHAHNYYLHVLGETGIIGLTAYIAVFITVIRVTWQTRTHPDSLSRCVAVGLMGTWVYLLVHSLTDNLYVNNMFIHLGVMLGLLAILNREVTAHVIVENV